MHHEVQQHVAEEVKARATRNRSLARAARIDDSRVHIVSRKRWSCVLVESAIRTLRPVDGCWRIYCHFSSGRENDSKVSHHWLEWNTWKTLPTSWQNFASQKSIASLGSWCTHHNSTSCKLKCPLVDHRDTTFPQLGHPENHLSTTIPRLRVSSNLLMVRKSFWRD